MTYDDLKYNASLVDEEAPDKLDVVMGPVNFALLNDFRTIPIRSYSDYIILGFNWEQTEDGEGYWDKIHKGMKANEENNHSRS